MALVPYLNEGDLSEADRPLLKRPINLFRALANSPDGARKFHGVGDWIRFHCDLDPRQRELAILQVGYLNTAPYEWSHHVKIGKDLGVTDADIRGLISVSNGGQNHEFDNNDLAVLTAAHELTQSRELTDTTVAVLKMFLSDARLVDLVLVISYYNAVVRVLGGLRVDVEEAYQQHLDAYHLPKR